MLSLLHEIKSFVFVYIYFLEIILSLDSASAFHELFPLSQDNISQLVDVVSTVIGLWT